MAKQTRNTLKGLFETGKKPTGANYADLIDSFSLVDGENTGSIDIQGDITTSGDLIINGDITASGNISASGTIFADTFQSHGSTEIGVSDSLNVTGGITASNISSSGYVSASAFSGDGSGLTNITASSLSIQQITASYLSGSIQATGSLTYTSGSTNVLYGIQSSGSIIPDSSNAWDLGGPSHKWKDVFLAGKITTEGLISASGDISASRLFVDQFITHNGDTNTQINFTDNRIQLEVGNLSFLDLKKDGSAPYTATINNGANQINFKVKDKDNGILFKTDSVNKNVGINTDSPGEDLEVVGNISASGDVEASSLTLPLTEGTSQDLATSTQYTVNGSKVKVKAITAAQIDDGAFASFTLLNSSIAADSVVIGNFVGNCAANISSSIITVAVTSSNSASVFIHNETGGNIAADTAFTASFVIL